MLVEHVAPDETMPVSGYERRTLKCPQCGDTESRLVFAGDKASAESAPVETASPVVEMTGPGVEAISAPIETASSDIETPGPVAEAPSPVVETISPIAAAGSGQDQIRLAPEGGPVAKPGTGSPAKPDATVAARLNAAAVARWTQAVEKVRTRHTALAQEAAAEKNEPAKTAVASAKKATDDFDRMWESPVPQRSRTNPPSVPKPGTPLRRPTLAPLRSAPAIASPALKRPAERPAPQSRPPQSTSSESNASPNAWARAVAMVRERLDRATKLDRNDAILRIDDNALKLTPGQGQGRPPKPEPRD